MLSLKTPFARSGVGIFSLEQTPDAGTLDIAKHPDILAMMREALNDFVNRSQIPMLTMNLNRVAIRRAHWRTPPVSKCLL
jgi:hypothetical protein